MEVHVGQPTTASGISIGRARRPLARCRPRVRPRHVAIIVLEGCVAGPGYVRGVELELVRPAMRCDRATGEPDPPDVVSVINPTGGPDAAAASVALPVAAPKVASTRARASRTVR